MSMNFFRLIKINVKFSRHVGKQLFIKNYIIRRFPENVLAQLNILLWPEDLLLYLETKYSIIVPVLYDNSYITSA